MSKACLALSIHRETQLVIKKIKPQNIKGQQKSFIQETSGLDLE